MRKACAKYVRTKSNEIKKEEGERKERERKRQEKRANKRFGSVENKRQLALVSTLEGRGGSSTSRRQGSMFTRIHSNMKPKTAKSSG